VDFSPNGRLIHIRHALEQTRAEDKTPELRIKEPKTNAGRRTIPLSTALADVLVRWRSSRAESDLALTAGDALVFPEDEGTIGPRTLMARSRLSGRWTNWRARPENVDAFGDVTFHDLRHSAASYWLRHAEPLFRVSRWLGHASINTTASIYGHETPDQDDAARISEPLDRIRAKHGQVVEIDRTAERGTS
jgi:integrase